MYKCCSRRWAVSRRRWTRSGLPKGTDAWDQVRQRQRLVEYQREDWAQLQPACAITSHRAQGSEWDNVVVVVSQSHYMMLQRNLLSSALTRARKRVVLIVSGGLVNKQTGRIYKSALDVAVANDKVAHRYSGLAERLTKLLGER